MVVFIFSQTFEGIEEGMIERIVENAKYRWKNDTQMHMIEGMVSKLNEEYVLSRFPRCSILILPSKEYMDEYFYDDFKSIKVYFLHLLGHAGFVPKDCIDDFDCPSVNEHIFSRLSKKSGYSTYYFPYTFLSRNNSFGDIDNLGFRLPHMWKDLKNRSSKHKLIIFFGNSSCFDQFSRVGERFTDILEEKLNKYFESKFTFTILNFGMTSALILNEMILYSLFAYDLNPDLVVSHSGYVDLLHGQISDGYMIENEKISYAKFYENWASKVHDHKEGLSWRNTKTLLPTNSSYIVCDAYIERIRQFQEFVSSYDNAKFILGLQPLAYHKKALSEYETRLIEKFKIEQKISFVESNLVGLYKIVTDKLNNSNLSFIDFPKIFSVFGEDKSYFADVAHQLPEANSIIAENYFLSIKKHYE